MGRWSSAFPETDHPGQLFGPPLDFLGDLAASLVRQGELDVLRDGVLLDQVIRLEDEADIAASDFRQLVVAELGDIACLPRYIDRWWGDRDSRAG